MDKQHIINEIIRTAEKNEGRPLGRQRFFSETGIKESDWYGKYWARWSDALKEAGFSPNAKQSSYDEDWLIEQLISFIREIGRFPVLAELRLKARRDKGFPSHTTFARLGNKAETARKILNHCHQKSGYEDVINICRPLAQAEPEENKAEGTDDSDLGHVYLIKSGRYYKDWKKQLYGTMLRNENGKFVPKPIEDEANVDKRRADLGLQPLAEYIRRQSKALLPKQKNSQ